MFGKMFQMQNRHASVIFAQIFVQFLTLSGRRSSSGDARRQRSTEFGHGLAQILEKKKKNRKINNKKFTNNF